MRPEVVWFCIGLVMLLLELALPGLIIFFFGVGAWVVAFICVAGHISLNMQITLFIVISLVLLVTLRKWLAAIFKGRVSSRQKEDDAAEEYLGRQALVTRAIEPGRKGRIELWGSTWDAEADESIPENTPVKIIGKDNITFKVKTSRG